MATESLSKFYSLLTFCEQYPKAFSMYSGPFTSYKQYPETFSMYLQKLHQRLVAFWPHYKQYPNAFSMYSGIFTFLNNIHKLLKNILTFLVLVYNVQKFLQIHLIILDGNRVTASSSKFPSFSTSFKQYPKPSSTS